MSKFANQDRSKRRATDLFYSSQFKADGNAMAVQFVGGRHHAAIDRSHVGSFAPCAIARRMVATKRSSSSGLVR